MDKNLIPGINILNKLRENDNMGKYPDQVIHYICKALWNIRWKYDKMMCGNTKCELKSNIE